jgi:hypothetical protein
MSISMFIRESATPAPTSCPARMTAARGALDYAAVPTFGPLSFLICWRISSQTVRQPW